MASKQERRRFRASESSLADKLGFLALMLATVGIAAVGLYRLLSGHW